MRSRLTTHLLLFLAFLFILAIIILCLIPIKKDYGASGRALPVDRTSEPTTKDPTHTISTAATEPTLTSSTTHYVILEDPEPTTETTVDYTTEYLTTVITTEATTESSTTPYVILEDTEPTTETAVDYTPEYLTTVITTETTTETSTIYTTEPSTYSETESTLSSTDAHFMRIYAATSTTTSEPTVTSTTESTSPSTTSSYHSINKTTLTTTPEYSTTPTTIYTTPLTTESTTSLTTESTNTPTTESTNTSTIESTNTLTTESTTTTTTESTTTTTTESSTTPTTETSTTPTTQITTNLPTTTVTTTVLTTITTTEPSTTSTTSSTTTEAYTDGILDHHHISEGACSSEDCKTVASRMLDMIDHSVDPCQDFYQYACGGVEDDRFLTPEESETNFDSVIKEQMHKTENDLLKFFDTCRSALVNPNALKYNLSQVGGREISLNDSENADVSLLLGELIKKGFAPFFDVTVAVEDIHDTPQFLPQIGFPAFDNYGVEHIDRVVCLNHLESQLKLSVRREHHTVNLADKYEEFVECMNETGMDARIQRIEEAATELGLFSSTLEEAERTFIIQVVKDFLINVYAITSTMDNDQPEVVTVGDLNRVLGSFIDINWVSFFGHLFEINHLDSNQRILIHHKEKLHALFQDVLSDYNARDLINILLLLWAEHAHITSQPNREIVSNYCFQTAKNLLPDDAQVLFIESFTPSQRKWLQDKVAVIEKKVEDEIINLLDDIQYSDATDLENMNVEIHGFNITYLRLNIDRRKNEIPLSANYLEDVYNLQRKLRKDMYSLIGKELALVEDCWYLPRVNHANCYDKLQTIAVPASYLVNPNLYFGKKIPNYLKYAGVTEFIAQKFLQLSNYTDMSVDQNSTNCFMNELQNPIVVQKRDNLEVTAMVHSHHEEKLLLASKAGNIAWRALKTLDNNSSPEELEITKTREHPLIWLGSAPLPPIKTFLIKNAQLFCESKSDFNLLKIVKGDHLPARFRTNILARNDPFFSKTFHCPVATPMHFHGSCLLQDTTTQQDLTTVLGIHREN